MKPGHSPQANLPWGNRDSYPEFLAPVFRLKDAIALMVSAMVGTGIFFSTGHILKTTTNSWIILAAWLLGGCLAYCGAITYGYLARVHPHAGGEYVYLKEAYSPVPAFLSGWVALAVSFSASVSVLGLAMFGYLKIFLPETWGIDWYTESFLGLVLEFGPRQVLGMFLILGLSFLNHRGVKLGIRMQNILTLLKILGLFGFLSIGFLSPRISWESLSPLPDISLDSLQSLLIATLTVTYSYLGWNMITYVAEEIRNPDKDIPQAIGISCLLVTTLYLGLNLLFLVSAPIPESIGKDEIAILSAKVLFGESSLPLLSGLICIILFGSMSAILIGGSRIYLAMARDRLFFPQFARLHPKHKTPSLAIWLQCFMACLFLFVRDIEVLLYMITFSILIMTSLISVIPMIYKFQKIAPEITLPGYPWTPLFFLFLNLFIGYELVHSQPESALWSLAITGSGIPLYLFFRYRKRNRKEGNFSL
jgi:APA family basic amino acid/polyamine antiporter